MVTIEMQTSTDSEPPSRMYKKRQWRSVQQPCNLCQRLVSDSGIDTMTLAVGRVIMAER